MKGMPKLAYLLTKSLLFLDQKLFWVCFKNPAHRWDAIISRSALARQEEGLWMSLFPE